MLYEHADQRGFKGLQIGVCIRPDQPGALEEKTMNSLARTAAAFAIAAAAAFQAGQSQATTFAAWEVANVAFGDTLNVRKYPHSTSQKQSAYPNGTVLQMTGRCTGGLNLLDIGMQPEWKQAQQVRYRWCEVWHDPAQNGDFVTGWVYGRYITPY